MNRELIPRKVAKAAKLEAALRLAADRQIVSGERVKFGSTFGGQHVAITDRRIIITKIGSFVGERAESIPIGAITGLAATLRDGRIMVLQLAVPGRTSGELVLSAEDLGPVHAALIRCLPTVQSAAP